MNRIVKVSLMLVSMIMLFSCDYDTHVINTVHKDGSVTRKVIMENSKEYFEPKNFRVPIDSTWQIEITHEINSNNDSLWFLTAEKHFNSVEEINEAYKNDKGVSRRMQRSADFSKSFKWFTTVFRYSESIEKVLDISCPMSDFLSDEEMKYIYYPQNVMDQLSNGPDSIMIREMTDTMEVKTELWAVTCLVRQLTDIFYNLNENHPELMINRSKMRAMESLFVKELIERSDYENDSILKDSVIISVLGQEFLTRFDSEIDYSVLLLNEMMDKAGFSSYNMEIRMPGKILASNGYAVSDSDSVSEEGILWNVDGLYGLTQPYEMWVESKGNNYVIWIISALFILFVIAGFIRYPRKGNS